MGKNPADFKEAITHGDLHELSEKRPSAAQAVSSGVLRYKKLLARTNAIVRPVERYPDVGS